MQIPNTDVQILIHIRRIIRARTAPPWRSAIRVNEGLPPHIKAMVAHMMSSPAVPYYLNEQNRIRVANNLMASAFVESSLHFFSPREAILLFLVFSQTSITGARARIRVFQMILASLMPMPTIT